MECGATKLCSIANTDSAVNELNRLSVCAMNDECSVPNNGSGVSFVAEYFLLWY